MNFGFCENIFHENTNSKAPILKYGEEESKALTVTVGIRFYYRFISIFHFSENFILITQE